MDRQEVETQRRREALEELRWRETCKKKSISSQLSPTWASAGALSDESLFGKIQLKEPPEVDAVSSSVPAMASPAKNDSFPEPPSQSKYYSTAIKAEPKPIPKEELMRRNEVEKELISLSKKITEETLRKEKMVPLIWDKPTFDPFASSDTTVASTSSLKSDSGGGKSDSESIPNPCKRRSCSKESKKSHHNHNIKAIRAPSHARAYIARARDESFYGGGYMGLGCYRKYCPEEEEILDDFVTLLDKYVPACPKRRKKPSTSTESSQD